MRENLPSKSCVSLKNNRAVYAISVVEKSMSESERTEILRGILDL
jgi:hypothetical protein